MIQLSEVQIDTLKELINIGVGRAAGVLNDLVKFRVSLQVPFVKVLSHRELQEEMKALGRLHVTAVKLGFTGPFFGIAALVLPSDSATRLVVVLTGEEPNDPELGTLRASTLSEVGNIVLNGVMGSIGNVINQRIHYSIPLYVEDTIENLLMVERLGDNPTVILVRTHFMIQELKIEGDIILIFGVGSFDALISAIDSLN